MLESPASPTKAKGPPMKSIVVTAIAMLALIASELLARRIMRKGADL